MLARVRGVTATKYCDGLYFSIIRIRDYGCRGSTSAWKCQAMIGS